MKKDKKYYLSLHPYEIYFSETEHRFQTLPRSLDIATSNGKRKPTLKTSQWTITRKTKQHPTPLLLKAFLMEIVSHENLNYRAYSAIATIPRQLFDYCVERELLTENPMDKVKIKKVSLQPTDIRSDYLIVERTETSYSTIKCRRNQISRYL